MAAVVLSLNELTSLSRQTLEALLGHGWDFDAAAWQVVWLQARGLEGVDCLLAAAPRLEASETNPSPTLAPLAKDGQWQTIDFQDDSWFRLGDLVFDRVIAAARLRPSPHFKILHGHDHLAVLPGLARCAKAGLAGWARWTDSAQGWSYQSWIEAGNSDPEYVAWPNQGSAQDSSDTVELCCGTESALRAAPGPAPAAAGTDPLQVTAQQFKQRFDSSIDHGVPLAGSAYQQLNDIARRVLIEASEASRRGAGA